MKIAINQGPIDRAARVVVGFVMIAMAARGTWGMWAWLGVVPLVTGFIGICPVYSVFGLNTCPVKRD